MHMLDQTNPTIDSDTLRKQSAVWEELTEVLGTPRTRAFARSWSIQVDISLDEVLEDLNYGRG